jgi:hypothetical protein
MTVVTDLGAVHATWFAQSDDCCAVSSELARSKAIRYGADPQRLHVTGIPIHPDFGTPRAAPPALRRELGLRTDLLTVLLLGGGAGIGRLETYAYALEQAGLAVQLLVVAGRNVALAEQLRARPWSIPVQVFEFVPLADLMHAADVVATKAGGLSVSEALAAGRPVLIHGAIPGQEEGNLRYIIEHDAGCWVADPPALVAQVARWLAHPEEMQRTAEAARRAGSPYAARDVAQLAWDLVEAGPTVNRANSAAQAVRQFQESASLPGAHTLPDPAVFIQRLKQQLEVLRQRLEMIDTDQTALEADLQRLGPQAGTSWRQWLSQQRWLQRQLRERIVTLEQRLAQLESATEGSSRGRVRAALKRLSQQVDQLSNL